MLLLSQVYSWNIKLNEHYVTMIPTCNLYIKSMGNQKEELFLPSFFQELNIVCMSVEQIASHCRDN